MSVLVAVSGGLLTYLLHSTVLLLVALSILRIAGRLSVPARELVLRVAVFGGFVTTALQSAFGCSPLSPWAAAAWRGLATTAAAPDSVTAGAAASADPVATGAASPAAAGGASALAAGADAFAIAMLWPGLLVAVWLIGAVWFAFGCLGASRQLRAALAGRRLLAAGELRELLDQNGGRGVRLSLSDRVWSPFAFGVWRPEICLPAHGIEGLARRERRCVLLHELAHVRGADPLWLPLYHYVGALVWFQPLHRVAVRRLTELAEYRCDDAAIRHGGTETALASALLAVAQWRPARAGERDLAMASSMAARPSLLASRVRRALAPQQHARRGWSRAAVTVFALPAWTTMAWLLPAPVVPGVGAAVPVALDWRAPESPTAAANPVVASTSELAALQEGLTVLLAAADEVALDAESTALVAEIRSRLEHAERLHRQITASQVPGSEPQPRKTP
ncbi:MAG: M56 family metallopeptidase [bacterium]|nr:M56 family metallopeptidase [bacterium]